MYKRTSSPQKKTSSAPFGKRGPSSRGPGSRGPGSRGPGSNNYRGRPNKRRGSAIDHSKFVKAAKPIEQTIYNPKNSFDDFEMSDILKDNLKRRNFVTPTQIQDLAIPVALTGRDVIGIANTGTGKTAAFLLPLLNKLINDSTQKSLIIAPTRELALQIEKECKLFSVKVKTNRAILIGGTPYREQFRQLNSNPKIIIGTVGRLKDHLDRGSLDLKDVKTIVLDEVDLMLDMGFVNDIKNILNEMPEDRQSLFFSATMTPTIGNLIQTFTCDPETIQAKTSETSDNVDQSVLQYRRVDDKIDHLHDLLSEDHVKKTLIFSSTKIATENLSNELARRGFKTDAIHGDKPQYKRQRALQNFRNSNIDILVATDVAARGIDINGISHVINYDIPQSYMDYTHRIGRTGRGNNIGYAITFVPQR